MPENNRRHSILDFVPNLSRKSANEYAGPCPWCGGNDRFIVWPNEGASGRFYCRRCQMKGNGCDLGRDGYSGSSETSNRRHRHLRNPLARSSLDPKEPDLKKWANAARLFVESLKGRNSKQLSCILNQRHISEETAEKYGITWNAFDRFDEAGHWGIESNKKVCIPAGLIIPVIRDDSTVSLTVRCANRAKFPKYMLVKGSRNDCLVLGEPGKPIVIVESHLDAYLIWQDAGDLVSVMSLSGTKKNFDARALELIHSSTSVFVATDFDETANGSNGAGQEAFFTIQSQLPNVTYLPTPIGKDPGEMVDLGVSIRSWLSIGLRDDCESISLPIGYPDTLESLNTNLVKFSDLIPCPKTSRAWSWVYRKDCASCAGHVQCINKRVMKYGSVKEQQYEQTGVKS